jgi:hypothetical protein
MQQTFALYGMKVMPACRNLYNAVNIFPSLRRFLGDVRREFIQRLYAVLHGTLGSYLRDALREGGAAAVTCLPAPTPETLAVPIFF